MYEDRAARDVLSPAGSPRHEVPARHARAALHRCLGERASYVTGNLYSCISNSRKLFSCGRSALLSRTSATSFMASPPLAASVHACLHSLKDCLGHAGGEEQYTNTLSLRYLRLNRSLEAAGVADVVLRQASLGEGDCESKLETSHRNPVGNHSQPGKD